MVETITPVVHGRRAGFVTAVMLHTLSATATAALTGAVLGGIGFVLGGPWGRSGIAVVSAVALLYLAREAFGAPIPLPQARRQVPEWWRTFFSPPVAASLYGAGLGVAFLTYLSYGTFAAVAAGALVSAEPVVGAALCAPFGLARSLAVAAVGWGSSDPGVTVTAVGNAGGTSAPRVANAVALTLVAVVSFLQVI